MRYFYHSENGRELPTRCTELNPDDLVWVLNAALHKPEQVCLAETTEEDLLFFSYEDITTYWEIS